MILSTGWYNTHKYRSVHDEKTMSEQMGKKKKG